MSGSQFLAALRANWLRIALMVLVATGVAFAFGEYQPRQYTAKARVMLNVDNPDPLQYSVLARGMEASYIGSEMHLVTETAVMKNVVTKLGWPDNPQVISAWQAATGGAGDVATWAAAQLAPAIAVRPLEDSSILEIYYAANSVEAAKEIVAIIRSAYIEESDRLRVEAAKRAAAWNRTQATRALTELRAAEATRAAFVTANRIPIDTPRGGLDYQEHMAATMQSAVPGVGGQATAVDPVVARLKRQLDAIDMALALPQDRGEQNPTTLALRAQRATIAQQYERELAVQRAGGDAPSALIGLVRQQRDAEYLKTRLNLISRAPLYDRLAELDRDVQLKTMHYNLIASRVANFEMAAAAPSGLRVIGDVIATDDPSYPNIPLMMGIAAASSLAFAVMLTLIGELRRRQVRTPEDLLTSTDAPILAVIAPSPRQRRRRRFALPLPRFGRPRPGFA